MRCSLPEENRLRRDQAFDRQKGGPKEGRKEGRKEVMICPKYYENHFFFFSYST